MKCAAVTKKKRPCPIEADRVEKSGEWKCHIHHSESLFQAQLHALKERNAARRDKRPIM